MPMMMALVVSVVISAAPKADPRLVGTWLVGTEAFITLAANGTGTMEGHELEWSARGSTITITVTTDKGRETDNATFWVNADDLTLTVKYLTVGLVRARAGVEVTKQGRLSAALAKADAAHLEDHRLVLRVALASALEASPAVQQQRLPSPPTGARDGGNDDPLSQLLLSSAWCAADGGNGTTTRIQYFRNGTWLAVTKGESKTGASITGADEPTQSGLWEVRKGQLWGAPATRHSTRSSPCTCSRVPMGSSPSGGSRRLGSSRSTRPATSPVESRASARDVTNRGQGASPRHGHAAS